MSQNEAIIVKFLWGILIALIVVAVISIKISSIVEKRRQIKLKKEQDQQEKERQEQELKEDIEKLQRLFDKHKVTIPANKETRNEYIKIVHEQESHNPNYADHIITRVRQYLDKEKPEQFVSPQDMEKWGEIARKFYENGVHKINMTYCLNKINKLYNDNEPDFPTDQWATFIDSIHENRRSDYKHVEVVNIFLEAQAKHLEHLIDCKKNNKKFNREYIESLY